VPGGPIVDGYGRYAKISDIPLSEDLDVESAGEKYKAILFFNHIKYESELEFKNTSPTSASKDGDLNGALRIEVDSDY
jgi:hypothetical protein